MAKQGTLRSPRGRLVASLDFRVRSPQSSASFQMLLGRQASRVACFPAGIEMGAGAGGGDRVGKGDKGIFSFSPLPLPICACQAAQVRRQASAFNRVGCPIWLYSRYPLILCQPEAYCWFLRQIGIKGLFFHLRDTFEQQKQGL